MRYLKIVMFISLLPVFTMCSGECKYKIFKEIPNSKKNYRVVKFFNWCGYTASNNINLSLLKNSDSVENRERMIFVSESILGSKLAGDTTVETSWLNDSTVLIEYNRNLQIFKKELILEGINITYRTK